MSFGVGELGLRLSELYDMPFGEYQLKAQAYARMQEEKLRHTRRIAFYAAIGSHLDPKKLPKDEHSFMPIGERKRNRASDEMKELFKQRMDEYNQSIQKT